MNTLLGRTLDIIAAKEAYDSSCKRLLANKEITARILKAVVPEYENSTIKEIICYISNVSIGESPVDADSLPPDIKSDNSEDTTITEGTRTFDIKFTAKAPACDNTEINLIINLEAQRKFNPSYSLLKRGIYYCSRLISSQLGTVFRRSEYDKIQKVYSIWVCTNPAEKFRNTINRYSMAEECLYGSSKADDAEYDLLTLIMVCLDNGKVSQGNELIELLSTIFSPVIRSYDKKKIMEEKFNIPMTENIDEEVEAMCNLSEDIYDRGINKGIEKGIEKGKAEGRAEGKAEGRAEGIAELLRNMISDKIKENESDEEILRELGRYGAERELIEEIRRECSAES